MLQRTKIRAKMCEYCVINRDILRHFLVRIIANMKTQILCMQLMYCNFDCFEDVKGGGDKRVSFIWTINHNI